MLLLTWIVATIGFATFVRRAKEQARIVKSIGQVGHVIYEHEMVALPTGGTRIDYDLEPNAPAWLRRCLSDDFFRRVTIINFAPTDRLMRDAASLPYIDSMSIVASELTDDAFLELERAGRLRKLSLKRGHGLTDQALQHIAAIDGLQILWISNTPVGDGGLSYLREARDLKDVVFQETLVTPEGADRLAKLLPNASIHVSGDRYVNTDIYRMDELRKHFKKNEALR